MRISEIMREFSGDKKSGVLIRLKMASKVEHVLPTSFCSVANIHLLDY